MEHGSLSEVRPGLCHRTISVRVSRLWRYRGGLSWGSVKLLHMVLSDTQGNHMASMVPTYLVVAYEHDLHEGLMCTLTHYLVAPRQSTLNMVDAPFVITFTKDTIVRSLCIPQDTFPRWVYRLTAINELPPPDDTPTDFVDVLGVITGISPMISYSAPAVHGTIRKRQLLLRASREDEITITLWGETADRFDGQGIHSAGQEKTVVAVFVGMTVRVYGESEQLAGGSACAWYMDESIPDINAFRSRHSISFVPICSLPTPHETVLQQQNDVPMWKIPLVRLLNFNSYEKKNGRFRCTVRIFRFMPGPSWWITCCTRCSRLATPVASSSTLPDTYKCSLIACPCTTATLRYRLCLIGRDATGEAEFILCGDAAQSIIGFSPDEIVRRYYHDASPITSMHVAASQIRHTPSEFQHVCSMICKLIVNVSASTFCGKWPSFLVSSVESCERVPVIGDVPPAIAIP